jgi:hypothetical protein
MPADGRQPAGYGHADGAGRRPLLEVTLFGALSGTSVEGRVRCVGPLPTSRRCAGSFEVEGIDYDRTTGDLRVTVIPPSPCRALTTSYRYRRFPG